MIGLNVDSEGEDALRERVSDLDLPYPVGLASPEILASYGGIRAVPTRLLLDRAGVLRKTYAGFHSEETLMADLAVLLAE